MADREKVIEYLNSEIYRAEQSVNDIQLECVEVKLLRDALELLKEQDRLLRKREDDVNKLCCEISRLKHLIHDKPLKEQEAVVRCKDCKHWDKYNVECMKRHHPVPPYGFWFCAEGKGR